jgi:hypothetical protein
MLYHNLIEAIGNTPIVEMPRMSPKPSQPNRPKQTKSGPGEAQKRTTEA